MLSEDEIKNIHLEGISDNEIQKMGIEELRITVKYLSQVNTGRRKQVRLLLNAISVLNAFIVEVASLLPIGYGKIVEMMVENNQNILLMKAIEDSRDMAAGNMDDMLKN